jgi:hypothetical protein
VPDAIAWKTDLPQATLTRRIRTVDQATTRNFRYQLRSSAGRWFITRQRLTSGGPAETLRTPFYPNQRFAHEVFIPPDRGLNDEHSQPRSCGRRRRPCWMTPG